MRLRKVSQRTYLIVEMLYSNSIRFLSASLDRLAFTLRIRFFAWPFRLLSMLLHAARKRGKIDTRHRIRTLNKSSASFMASARMAFTSWAVNVVPPPRGKSISSGTTFEARSSGFWTFALARFSFLSVLPTAACLDFFALGDAASSKLLFLETITQETKIRGCLGASEKVQPEREV